MDVGVQRGGAVRVSLGRRMFRPDVEGLRAVAVLLIVLAHAGVPGPAALPGLGIDLSFAISGYLMATSLIHERVATGGIAVRAFWARRMWRTVPAATAVLVATVLATFIVTGGFDLAAVAHLRVLAIQVLGAGLFPAVGAVIGSFERLSSRTGALVCFVLAAVVAASVLSGYSPAWPGPLLALTAGSLLALRFRRFGPLRPSTSRTLGWAGVAGIGAALGVPDPRIVATAMGLAGGLAIMEAGARWPRQGLSRVLALPPMVQLGRWAYAIYLCHWPLLHISGVAGSQHTDFPATLSLVMAAFGLAVALYYLLDDPVRQHGPAATSSASQATSGR